jgi:hypothetical protein
MLLLVIIIPSIHLLCIPLSAYVCAGRGYPKAPCPTQVSTPEIAAQRAWCYWPPPSRAMPMVGSVTISPSPTYQNKPAKTQGKLSEFERTKKRESGAKLSWTTKTTKASWI